MLNKEKMRSYYLNEKKGLIALKDRFFKQNLKALIPTISGFIILRLTGLKLPLNFGILTTATCLFNNYQYYRDNEKMLKLNDYRLNALKKKSNLTKGQNSNTPKK